MSGKDVFFFVIPWSRTCSWCKASDCCRRRSSAGSCVWCSRLSCRSCRCSWSWSDIHCSAAPWSPCGSRPHLRCSGIPPHLEHTGAAFCFQTRCDIPKILIKGPMCNTYRDLLVLSGTENMCVFLVGWGHLNASSFAKNKHWHLHKEWVNL